MYTISIIDIMYQPTLSVRFPLLTFNFEDFNQRVYDFINCEHKNIKSILVLLDWGGIFYGLCINDAINAFFYENIF